MYQPVQVFINDRIRNPSNYGKFVYALLCVVVVFLFLWSYNYTSLRASNNFVFDGDKRYKKIFIWNTFWGDATYEFGLGSEPFHVHNCTVQDCVIVYDVNKKYVEYYDAVVFHGPEFNPRYQRDYPSKRNTYQRYVYFSMESPLTRPAFTVVENFYNWTMSYRLDSEILVIYFAFYDIRTNEMVSNTLQPKWLEKTIDEKSLKGRETILESKRKPVAWFVSNCNSKNKRQNIVENLKRHISVDVYGKCGPLKCLRDDPEACNSMLRRDYYFYLSFENSNCVDYITEKLATAYTNDLIPVYYGGVNLTKFVPPHSYIDARNMSAKELADRLQYLIDHPKEYLEYFWWKDFYRIDTREKARYKPFCKLCEMLHNESLPPKTYDKFYKWWNTYEGHNACNSSS